MCPEEITKQLLKELRQDFRNLKDSFTGLGEVCAGTDDQVKKANEDKDKAREKADFEKWLAAELEQKWNAAQAVPDPNQRQKAETDSLGREYRRRKELADAADARAKDLEKEADAAAKHRDRMKADPEADAQSTQVKENAEWLVFKTDIAIRSIEESLRSRQPLEQSVEDAGVVFKEIRARAVATFTAVEVHLKRSKPLPVQDCQGALGAVSDKLFLIGLSKNPQSPQAAFLKVYFSGQRAKRHFQRALDKVKQWKAHWPYMAQAKGTDFPRLEELIGQLLDRSGNISDRALELALTCDPEKSSDGSTALCEMLNDVYLRYEEAVCHLGRIQISPDVEPRFHNEVQQRLDFAGAYVAYAFQALNAVQMPKQDRAAQLVAAWAALVQRGNALTTEIVRLEQTSQVCPPPNPCLESITQLRSFTQAGSDAARRFQLDPTNCSALGQQQASLKQLQLLLCDWSDRGLQGRLWSKLGWSMARIGWLLSECHEDTFGPLLLTRGQRARLYENLMGAKGPLKLPESDRPTRRQFEKILNRLDARLFGAPPPTCFAPSSSSCTCTSSNTTPASGTASTNSPAQPASYLAVWSKSANLAQQLECLVSPQLKAATAQLVGQIDTEQTWLQGLTQSPGVSSASVIQRTSRRWRTIYASLVTINGLAQDNTMCKTDQSTVAQARTQLLSSLDTEMRNALGLSPAAPALVAPAAQGATS
jgi:hypothetical protein